MKKFLLMAVAAFSITLSANAQTQRPTDPSQKEVRDHSRKSQYANLDLTQAQKDQFKKMREENKVQRDAIKNDKSLTDAQRGEKMKELNKSQKEKMNSVLTKEQKEKMKADRKNHKMKGKKWQGHKKPAATNAS